ncbi:MAG: hypothetical protein V2A69_00115 [Pseudomonadota bacterium]
MIKTGGEWICSLELEDIISQHEAISEATVIGVPDEKWGERPLAMVVLREEYKEKIKEDEIKKFLMKFVKNGTIPKYGVPDRIIITGEYSEDKCGEDR